jgi:hypothetical protein
MEFSPLRAPVKVAWSVLCSVTGTDFPDATDIQYSCGRRRRREEPVRKIVPCFGDTLALTGPSQVAYSSP